jgi:hypothetical protein
MGMLTALSVPLMILNVLGGIVSGIWLAVLRDWHAVWLGIVFFFVSSLILGFALMPSILLAAPAAYFAERGKTIGLVFFGGLSSLYTLALITVWCCGVLVLFVKDATHATIIPRLIWSYGVAIGPLTYMASKDQGEGTEGFGSNLATFLAELAYFIVMLSVIFLPISLLGVVKVFGSFMLVGLVIQTIVAVYIQREQSRLAR